MKRIVGNSVGLRSILEAEGVGQVPCIVGSPPYNVAIPNYPSGYDDHRPWHIYRSYAHLWAIQIYHSLEIGGRCWINVQPTVPMVPGEPAAGRVNLAQIWHEALVKAGLDYRDTVFWIQDNFDGACAWGSWRQPSSPNLRGGYEVILSYYKIRWQRPMPKEWKGKPQPRHGPGGDWTDLVRNVWKINPANPGTWHHKVEGGKSATKRNLPALYPIEVPLRCIRLSTWPGEWVVDPWAGHCTTGYAADQLERPSLMVDLGYADDHRE